MLRVAAEAECAGLGQQVVGVVAIADGMGGVDALGGDAKVGIVAMGDPAAHAAGPGLRQGQEAVVGVVQGGAGGVHDISISYCVTDFTYHPSARPHCSNEIFRRRSSVSGLTKIRSA